ncbi:DNA primase [Candidatus Giovannonibacteria bacterium RIFCSPHIGHO2_02_43_13]|uniref:DNA primase n=1 Tax=Candidatus Giovannonibacteria bacterium RIFCSPHIGHO2_02_43_13 TaxID=1798330 RepID=A0A1F5WPW1_9BACT|nr:MAG: primase protein [Parcubacteria group bacterium GW2011_GWA2_44_13]OGF72512.1 MAG: DNA primase [Candidatus Giovannonibacteria bacterium RIFCSPHIGHO2_12_FULL_44_42]OGF77699.1 MAG: DNA primase [Candidatus Giovannonibacteria bacterium RIFCSPHIGHO2_02_43_13]OGF88955.1 MAG: DNA primase [Candidatus Giovannonibacteria bacterium RIFCSPLOWO2_02_FULL_43_54]OGF97392.1 MAG: DNA primase [Candidatus Giovannonibacteria bacterium RIFCSPLOWO2_12_FULL_44_32]
MSQVEDIKTKIDIIDLVGSYIRLTKAGSNFKARCPFHNEKTPSFNVSPARQIWHCFGCGKGGDVIEFVKEIEGVEFFEALKMLADRAGVELVHEDASAKNERTRTFSLLEDAAKFYEEELAHSDFLALNPLYGGSDASPKSECARSPLAYLRSRGLIDETIKEFRIGYAPQEWKSIFNHLLEKGFKADEIECAGLIVKSQNSKVAAQNYYDRFRGRIMFPIFDALGRVIAFGGRMFPDRENEAKYVNSPETNLYQKSKVLYGFNKSKSAILKAGECIVVEGYMDMIMSYQSGVKNVVASSGTALTADQLKILRRLSEKLITAFDMDKAGEDAARRGIALALTEGFEVGVAGSLSGLKDPADAVRKDPKIWKDAVKNSRHVIQFYIDTALAKFPASSHEAKREFQRTVIPAIVSLPDLEKAHWIKQIGKTLDIAEEAVWEALRKLQNPNNKLQTAENEIKQAAPNDRKLLLEGKILGILAQYPMLADKVESNFEPLLQRKGTAAVFAELFLNGAIEAETELAHCQRELKKEYLKARLENLSQIMREAEKNGNGGDRNILEFQRLMSELSKMQ